MHSFFRHSLRNKLLALFMGIGLLPFITLLIYTLFLSESKMVNKTVLDQSKKTEVIIDLIDNHLLSLQKEVAFLSSLDLMDDMLAEDIDKRISRLLIQKADDLNMNLKFFALNENSVVIASSDRKELSHLRETKKLYKPTGTYIEGSKLYIYSLIHASFDKTKELGYLFLEYDLNNLDRYLIHQESIYSFLINPKTEHYIGKILSLNIDYKGASESFIKDNYVLVYKKFDRVLSDFYIVYAVDKSVALEFLYDFIKFMLYMAVAIFILVVYLALRHSKEIVKPIEELTKITDEIIQTRNYSRHLDVSSDDEIGTLTHSFNMMLETTSSALSRLELENKLRLQRFTQLIDVFNTIIQTKSEDECIDTSIEEIKTLTGKEKLHFSKVKLQESQTEYTELYVTDFEKDTKIYFGAIELGIGIFKDKYERDFYNSIASMITLQLDRIRLIERTMSASNAKSAFISNMSHELRTPLNAIIGFSQYLIMYEELNEDQIETVGSIESSAQYLLGMINEILDIAKIEAGKMEAHIESVKVLDLLSSSYEMLAPLASDKELTFEFIHENFDESYYKTDPKMFKQIVVNLISNAIKFTQEGSVLLTLTTQDEKIIVSVKDSGLGIAKEDLDALFNDFTQLENVMQKKHKGTGLGLSLSKKMAKILGGDVELKSEGLGEGVTSIFYISMVK